MTPFRPACPRLVPPVLLLSLGLSACSPAAKTPPPDPQMRSQALIDSGNVAFKAKDFEGAARRYASAVAIRPDDPAAHYGLGMALSRLGRDDEAREEYARARALLGRSGDSLATPH